MAVIALLQGGRRGFTIYAKGADYNFSVQFSSQKNYWDTHIKEIGGVVRGVQSMQQHNATMNGPLILI